MVVAAAQIPRVREPWAASARIIASRFPPVGLFDRVTDPADLDAVLHLETLTNPRVRVETGELGLVPPAERVAGPGTTPIMAAFTHLNPAGSRFSDGTYGVYYCGRTVETAIRETAYHRERFLREFSSPPIRLDMRVYYADLNEDFHDIRGLREQCPEWYDPDRYDASRTIGRALRDIGSWGIYYHSVRHAQGQCAAVFRPRAVSNCRQGEHYGYLWDGSRISKVLELKTVMDL